MTMADVRKAWPSAVVLCRDWCPRTVRMRAEQPVCRVNPHGESVSRREEKWEGREVDGEVEEERGTVLNWPDSGHREG